MIPDGIFFRIGPMICHIPFNCLKYVYFTPPKVNGKKITRNVYFYNYIDSLLNFQTNSAHFMINNKDSTGRTISKWDLKLDKHIFT